jgi:hypothetical protein
MSRLSRFNAGLAVALALGGSASAAEVEVHGFLSQGLIASGRNAYLSPHSTEGSFELNEAGINVGSNLSRNLRVGAQFYMRDMGDYGQHDVSLDWVLVDYFVSEELGIRAGRIKAPGGLYQQIQDFDFLRSYALLPASAYDPTFRELANAYNGLAIYGSFELGGAGRLEYQAGAGDLSFSTGGDIAVNARGLGLPEPVAIESDYAAAAALDYYPVPELRIVLSAFHAHNFLADTGLKIDGGQQLGPFRLGDLVGLDTASVYAVAFDQHRTLLNAGVQYTAGPWSFDLEYRQDRHTNHRDWDALNDGDFYADGGYVGASVRIGDHWQVGGYYSKQWDRNDDRDGQRLASGTLSPSVAIGALRGKRSPDYQAWRQDVALGVNYFVSNRWIVKLEGHLASGTARLGFYNADTPASDRSEDWRFLVLKTSFSF